MEYKADHNKNSISEMAITRSGTVSAPYLDELNPQQRIAVETLEGPVLVLAGAGTGKTKVLTTRLAHIVNTKKAWPREILAVTFTNKAAKEMRQRVGGLIGDMAEGMRWLGTFHSIGAKILRRHAELVGLKSDFVILDTDDQLRLYKQLIRDNNIDEKRWPPRVLAAHIDNWKNRGLTPEQIPKSDMNVYDGKGATIYQDYQNNLKLSNAVDFGDLLLECLKLFQNNPDILNSYHEQFKFIMVDEYQDTNVAQYLWLRLLAQRNKNICCVGDDDQSIYGWRGAEVDNILRFEKDFPGATVISLETNYRSTQHILAAASGLISNNEDRLGKELYSNISEGNKVQVRCVWDNNEEARIIGEDIEQLQRKGQDLEEIAILVRASFQMRSFEDSFITLGIPYRVVGGAKFYERAEIRDALAYLKVTAQPDNGISLERIINTPKRSLGKVTVAKIRSFANEQQLSLFAAIKIMIEQKLFTGKIVSSLQKLIADFTRWNSLIQTILHNELAELILDESGYTEMWRLDKTPNAVGKVENLKELVRSMAAFSDLNEFLEHIALVMDRDQGINESKVNIMTLHSAKGLEFDTIFLPGWEEGVFPHQRSLDEEGKNGLEEERRLAYVGLTRAKKLAKIFFAQNRQIHHLWQNSMPSRFIDELPRNNVEVVSGDSSSGFYLNNRSFTDSYGAETYSYSARKQEMVQFSVGERVFHDKFGYGNVIAADNGKLIVDFDISGNKKIMAKFLESA